MILLDTSVLIDSLTGPKRSGTRLRQVLERGERMTLSALVIYEWLRGPRTPAELATQEELFPTQSALPFEHGDAQLAARLYRGVTRPRGREIDLSIAACAIRRQAELWTLNPADFGDIPGLRLVKLV